MELTPEQALKLLDNGSISNETFEDISNKSHEKSPKNPESKEKKGALGKIFSKINPLQIAGDVASAVNDYGKFSAQDTAQTPTFDVTREQTTASKENIPAAKQEALEAAKRAGEIEQNILTPTAQIAKQNILNQTRQNLISNQKRTDEVWSQFQIDQENARNFLESAKQKAVINPNRYLQEMGVGDKILTAVGLVIGGIGTGITGKTSFAEDFLKMQIQNDINAQQKNIENDILRSARASQIGQNEINAGQISAMSKSIATQMVTAGSLAAVEAAKNQVQGATAVSKADALIFPLQQQELDAQLKYDEIAKGLYSAQDYNTLSLFGKYLEKLGAIPNSKNAKNRLQTTSNNT